MNAINRATELIPGTEEFKWPAPPYHAFLQETPGRARESCVVTVTGGAELRGELLAFVPDAAVIQLAIPGDAETPPTFADLVHLRLPQPVRVKLQTLPREASTTGMLPVVERQTYTIELHSGESLTGQTQGFINARCGLFLFPPASTEEVSRMFVPRCRIKAVNIGDPIGQILIDKKMASPEAVSAALARQRWLRAQKLGDLLTLNQIVTPAELTSALAHQQQRPIERLGQVLTELGLVTADELEQALKEQERNRTIPLGQILTEMGLLDKEVIEGVMRIKLGIPFVNLRKFDIQPELIGKVPYALATRYAVIPVFQMGTELVVAIENPLAVSVLDELRFATGMKIRPVIAAEEDIRGAIERSYRRRTADASPDVLEMPSHDPRAPVFYRTSSGGEIPFERETPQDTTKADVLAFQLASEGEEPTEAVEEQVVESSTTLVRLINKLIIDAHQQKASDIHIETYPGKKNIQIRLRKDGALFKYLELPSKFRNALVSRIKIMSTLDISERRKPQDGKIDFRRFGPITLELRVATIPTVNGLEDVVMRLLGAAQPLPLAKLGFSDHVLHHVQRLMTRPHGLCLVCGPTGSGKTTTLHSLLGHINTDERRIWTAEDPIEITQPGLRQVQVNAKIGWTFAAAMRSFLRADPDVIMVGEMRDAETTKTGIEASLTGHLVLSTLHTNSAPESVVRLLDMGMNPFNFADALLCILAQRLARKLCATCKQSYVPARAELDELLAEYCLEGELDPDKEREAWQVHYGNARGDILLHHAPGCDNCRHTGYQGRVGLHELLVADPTIKHLIQTRAAVSDIKSAAMAAGMRTLKQNGIEKILQGISDIAQIRAVCG